MSIDIEINETTRRSSLAALRWDAAWIDPALRRMAETAAQRSGLAVEAWMERAIRNACGMAPMAASPAPAAAPGPLQNFAAMLSGARHDDAAAEPDGPDGPPSRPAAMSPLDAMLRTMPPELPEPELDDDEPLALSEALAEAALEPEAAPRRAQPPVPYRAPVPEPEEAPLHAAAPAALRRPLPPIPEREARGISVGWAAGIAAVLAFVAVVAVRDPGLLRGHLFADNDRGDRAAAPATASAPLHAAPQASDRAVALAMVPPPPAAEDNEPPPPKIALTPPEPVATAPAPSAVTRAMDTPTETPATLPPPSVALGDAKPVQTAALPQAGAKMAQAEPSELPPEPAAAKPAQPAPAARARARVAAPAPVTAMAERPTQVAMAPAAAPPPPSATAQPAGAPAASDAKAAAELESRVKAGDHVAEYRLGILYALGKGVPRDYPEAAKLLRASAESGLAEAQYDYGVLCDKGLGVTRDSAEAARWYSKAADQGHPPAALNLGYAYAEGLGVSRNLPEAARWFRRAAEAGLINAQFNLAYMFEQGAGVTKSLTDAYAWYSVAAEKGDQGAQQAMDRIALKLTPHELQFAKARIRAVKRVIRVQN